MELDGPEDSFRQHARDNVERTHLPTLEKCLREDGYIGSALAEEAQNEINQWLKSVPPNSTDELHKRAQGAVVEYVKRKK